MSDPEILAELERACFPDDFWTLGSICGTLERNDILYRIEYREDGSPYGYCIGAAAFGEAELYRIGVLPEFRRRGIGKRILTNFIKACPSDTKKIFLEVKETNKSAIALYQSSGFKSVSKRTGYYGGGKNALIMELETVQ